MKEFLLTGLQIALIALGVGLVFAAPYTVEGLIYWIPGIGIFMVGVIPFLKNKAKKKQLDQ